MDEDVWEIKIISPTAKKVIRATLLAPLSTVPAVFVLITAMIVFQRSMPTDVWQAYWAATMAAMIGTVISYLATLLYGLPVYWLLNKINENNAFSMLLAGIFPVIIIAIANNYNGVGGLSYLPLAYFSSIVSLTFWYIANR